jgi:hypothetical protein
LAQEAELMQRTEMAYENKERLKRLTSVAQDLQYLNMDINTTLK